MGAIVDTGIVLEIMAVRPEEDTHNAMLSWIKGVAGRTLPPRPRGRRVAMFVSPGACRD